MTDNTKVKSFESFTDMLLWEVGNCMECKRAYSKGSHCDIEDALAWCLYDGLLIRSDLAERKGQGERCGEFEAV